MEVGDVYFGPTGIRAEVEQETGTGGDGADPRSVMATITQSYEQACMRVILELEEDREEKSSNRFRVALWLHDGAYVRMRSECAREEDLAERLEEKCRELAEFAGKDTPLPAFFEVEEVEPKMRPDESTASADGDETEGDVQEESLEEEVASSPAGDSDSGRSGDRAERTPIPGPSVKERVPIGQEPRTLRESKKTDLPVLHVGTDGAVTIGPEPEYIGRVYPTAHGPRRVPVGPIGCGVYWLKGGARRDGDWATDSILYELKLNGSYRFVEIHRRRGIREVPDLEVGERVLRQYRVR